MAVPSLYDDWEGMGVIAIIIMLFRLESHQIEKLFFLKVLSQKWNFVYLCQNHNTPYELEGLSLMKIMIANVRKVDIYD